MSTDTTPAQPSCQSPVEADAYRRADTLGRLALLTADALESAVDAALAGDRAQARRVIRKAAARTSARTVAESCVRLGLAQRPPRSGNLRLVASRLQLIADLGQIGHLVNTLARHTANGEVRRPVPCGLQRDAWAVGCSGARRLRLISEGLPAPAMDRGYVRTGDELRAVVDHLTKAPRGSTPPHPDHAPVQVVCAELATCVLNASRHAACTA